MRKLLQYLLIVLPLAFTVLSFTPINALAPGFGACSNETAQTTDICQTVAKPTATNPIITALKWAINIFSFIIGVTAVIVIVVAGLNMITSSGDAQAFAKARMNILYSLVGLLIVVAAQTIVGLVLNRL